MRVVFPDFPGDVPQVLGWRDSYGPGVSTRTKVGDLNNRFELYEQDLLKLESDLTDLKMNYSGAANNVRNAFNRKETDLHERYSKARQQNVVDAKKHIKNPLQLTKAVYDVADYFRSFHNERVDVSEAKDRIEIEEQRILDGVYSAESFVEEIGQNVRKYHLDRHFKEEFEKIKASGVEHIDVSLSFEDDDWKERSNRVNAAREAFKDTEEIYRIFIEENSGENLMNQPEALKNIVNAKREKYYYTIRGIKGAEKRENIAFAHFMAKVLEHPGL